MTEPKRKPTGSTGNRDRYRNAFIGHVHSLLHAGYSAMIPKDFTESEEDDITGELCKHMQHLTEVAPTSPWMGRYSIHDQNPVNDATDDKTGQPRKGKRRPVLDIRIVSKSRVPNTSFSIEAKRLYRSDSVSSYMGDEGLKAFTEEYYVSTGSACGMLAYVQSGQVAEWVARIHQRLLSENTVRLLPPQKAWIKTQEWSGLSDVYRSRHRLSKSGEESDVFHTLLNFSNV